MKQEQKIAKYERALETIYRNTLPNFVGQCTRNLIESLAEELQGDFKYNIDILKEELTDRDYCDTI